MSTALSGHLKMSDLDELARVNPDIVGVRGAVCQKGDRDARVYWESVAEFKTQLDLRATGEINVHNSNGSTSQNGTSDNDWIVIDGTNKNCAGIIAELSEQISKTPTLILEVIIPDVLNTYPIII